MPVPTPDTPPARPDSAAPYVARLNSCWPHVCVEVAHVTPGAAGDHARALVQLGGLTPADVRVELMPAGAADSREHDPRDEHRMFSSQAFGNGCFVFDTTIPHRDTAQPPEWLIHVHPSAALEEPRVEYRFRSDST